MTFDIDQEIKDANWRIQARINDSAREAFARVDPHCVEAQPPPSLSEMLGMRMRKFSDALTAMTNSIARGWERGES